MGREAILVRLGITGMVSIHRQRPRAECAMVTMLVSSMCARRPGGGRFYLRRVCADDRAKRARREIVDPSQHTQACFFVVFNNENKLDCTPPVRQESYRFRARARARGVRHQQRAAGPDRDRMSGRPYLGNRRVREDVCRERAAFVRRTTSPYARVGLVRICAGALSNERSYRDSQ